MPVEFAWSHLPGSQWLTMAHRDGSMNSNGHMPNLCLIQSDVSNRAAHHTTVLWLPRCTVHHNRRESVHLLPLPWKVQRNFPKSSALAVSATPQVATTHVLGCQATKPMMTAFTKMMRPMKESKKDEEINSCMLRRCLSSLGEVRPGVVLVVLQHLRVYV